MDKIKTTFISVGAALGALTSTFLGGWDKMLQALLFFMIVDYLLGIVVAGVFKNSPKTTSGGISSKAGFKGIVKKVVMVVLVMLTVQADNLFGTNNFFRDACIWALLANELYSIIENIGLTGIKMPPVINNIFDLLTKKANGEDNNQ